MTPAVDTVKLQRLRMDLLEKSASLRGLSEAYRRELEPVITLPGDPEREVDHAHVAALKERMDALEAECAPLARLMTACERYAAGR